MKAWLCAFRGALLTWVALPGAIFLFAATAIALAVGASYHPMAPIASQRPILLGLMALTLVALVTLAIRHGTPTRRAAVKRNLVELGALVAGFVLAFGLIVIVIKGPNTIDLVLFGQTYRVPTLYRPLIIVDETGRGELLVMTVCKPDDTPVYATNSCRNQAEVRFGDTVLTDDFFVDLRLQEAGATHTADVLNRLGAHLQGDEPGEIVYTNTHDELRLWLDDGQKVTVVRHCERTNGVDCTAMVRQTDRTMIFPVYDVQTTASRSALQHQAQTWMDKIAGWRCPVGGECPD